MEAHSAVEDFMTVLRSLVGKPCWAFAASEVTGSDVTLDFGRKIPRAIPLMNPSLGEDLRYHEGEISLYLCCAWRLDSEETSICSSGDSSAPEGPVISGLRLLVGTVVESVELFRPLFDLRIRFGSKLVLNVFCDLYDRDEESENYTVFVKDKLYDVRRGGKLGVEPRRTEGMPRTRSG